jgi:DNA-binding helix-hairpin-helix protein with protein kinase domain
MTTAEVIVDGRPMRLGATIGRGGEGTVYALGSDSSYAAKIYQSPQLYDREQKITAMVQAGLFRRTSFVTFPLSVVRDRRGSFLGFVMRLVKQHRPLHDIYAPGSRKQYFPQADYRFLVHAASNVARAVASVHQTGCVIGDINHSSMLVSPRATVALVDADSFQVTHAGRTFPCRVGVPEYTPPELQGKNLSQLTRSPNHDAFGLAVVIFQLLFMGRHPFSGSVRRGETPQISEAIQQFRYVYAENRNVGMDQPPGTPAISDFSQSLAITLDAAFSDRPQSQRPLASAWVQVLEALEGQLSKCQVNTLHFIPRDAGECAWCEMENQLGVVLFIPFVPHAQLITQTFDPGAGGFNLDAIWKRIERELASLPSQLQPSLTTPTLSPSSEAQKAAHAPQLKNIGRGIAGFLAVILFFTNVELWILWLPLALWAWLAKGDQPSISRHTFDNAFVSAETTWHRELENWRRRTGAFDFTKLSEELRSARAAYQGLASEQKVLIDKYRAARREKQLLAFLDTFDIAHARIHGIGPAKQAVLASYGIDTAADITHSRVLATPGFGEVNSLGLFAWRARLEQRFVYRTEDTDADRQELIRIRTSIETKALSLRQKLLTGPQNLNALARRVAQVLATPDPLLNRAHVQRMQAKCDLEFLKLPVPTVPQPPTAHSRPSSLPPGIPLPTSTGPTSTTLPCPRCSSPMARRLARRGRNAGGYFWGCTRYPLCKGTRNI